MSPISLCLLLPIACVVALPSQYSYYAKDNGGQQELPNEFWSQHFGPDFKHAVHLQLEQTHFIDNGNAVAKNQSENPSINKKRSAYIVHKSQQNDQNLHEAMGNSMRVHLLQPDEMEALEREMLKYARGNPMMQSPVVVNLPESEGSQSKNPGQDDPVVLNIPPVVYHSSMRAPNQRYQSVSPYMQSGYSQSSSFYDQMIPYQRVPSSYISMQPAYEYRKPSQEEISPSESEAEVPSYKEPRQKYDEAVQPSEEESKQKDDSESQDSSNSESKA